MTDAFQGRWVNRGGVMVPISVMLARVGDAHLSVTVEILAQP